MANFNVNCPHCGQLLEVQDEWTGKQVTCPSCQNPLIIPARMAAVPLMAILSPTPPESAPAAGMPEKSGSADAAAEQGGDIQQKTSSEPVPDTESTPNTIPAPNLKRKKAEAASQKPEAEPNTIPAPNLKHKKAEAASPEQEEIPAPILKHKKAEAASPEQEEIPAPKPKRKKVEAASQETADDASKTTPAQGLHVESKCTATEWFWISLFLIGVPLLLSWLTGWHRTIFWIALPLNAFFCIIYPLNGKPSARFLGFLTLVFTVAWGWQAHTLARSQTGQKEQTTAAVNKTSSQSSSAEQMFKLGKEYHQKLNHIEAAKWYRKAAEQGLADAQYWLGVLYYHGFGVSQDYTEAVKWYRKAAEQGQAESQCDLGGCYEDGHGVSQDYTEAVKWYRKAAEQGHAESQIKLGHCYERGHGVSYDYTETVKWYRKAAEQGDTRAQYWLGVLYYHGFGESLEKQDYTEAVKWYRKAAEQGDRNAQYELGICYEYGNGVPRDREEMVKWYRKAAVRGHKLAQKELQKLQEWNQ